MAYWSLEHLPQFLMPRLRTACPSSAHILLVPISFIAELIEEAASSVALIAEREGKGMFASPPALALYCSQGFCSEAKTLC
jgi:hypothetical protein